MYTEKNIISEEKIVSDILESGFVIVDIDKIIKEEYKKCYKEWKKASDPSANFVAEYYCLDNNLLEIVEPVRRLGQHTDIKCTTRFPITIIESHNNNTELSRNIFDKGDAFYVSAWNEEQERLLKNYLKEKSYM